MGPIRIIDLTGYTAMTKSSSPPALCKLMKVLVTKAIVLPHSLTKRLLDDGLQNSSKFLEAVTRCQDTAWCENTKA